MSYTNTFIQVAPDCPVSSGVAPIPRGLTETIPVIEYELLTENPYKFTQDELIFATHIRRQGISTAEASRRRSVIWTELFRKPHPCMRASALPKKYGWGVHHDKAGRIAIYAMDSKEYAKFTRASSAGPKLILAVRSKRA